MTTTELNTKIDAMMASLEGLKLIVEKSASKDDVTTLRNKFESEFTDVKQSLEFMSNEINDVKKLAMKIVPDK